MATVPEGKRTFLLRDGRRFLGFEEGQELPALSDGERFEQVDAPVLPARLTPAECRAALELKKAQGELLSLDRVLPRVVEDILDALRAKGIMAEADLPQVVQDRLAAKRSAREALRAIEST